MRKYRLCCTLIFFLLLTSVFAKAPATTTIPSGSGDPRLVHQSLFVKVISITDGDTIRVLYDNQSLRIRLNGIDCPEKKQAYGTAAKEFTANLVFSKYVSVRIVDIDRYGRYVADIYLGDVYVNAEIVKAGYAWHYKQYSDSSLLARCENEARLGHRGLWRDANPTPPCEFRKKR